MCRSDKDNENELGKDKVIIIILTLIIASVVMAASSVSDRINDKKLQEMSPDEKYTVIDPSTENDAPKEKIDINKATRKQLTDVKGIGEATADNIIDYRYQIGGFTSIDQLMEVKGIGEKTAEKLKEKFCVPSEEEEAGETLSEETAADPSTENDAPKGKIDINKATREQLTDVKGIGEATADNIIDYRDQIGGFTRIDQLMEVKGIGEKTAEKLKEKFCVPSEEDRAGEALSEETAVCVSAETSFELFEDETEGSAELTVTSAVAVIETAPAVTETSPTEISVAKTDAQSVTSVRENLSININTASEEELMQLKGVGPKIAARIVEYRETHGGFSSIEEIKEVSGIGDKKFEDMKDIICV